MPAEHGAWGLVSVPFLCAAGVANTWNVPLLLAAVCILALFLLRGSLNAHGTWRAAVSLAHLALASVATAGGGALVFLFKRWELLWLALTGMLLYLFQEWLIGRHEENRTEKRSLMAELVGVVVLSLTAPAAWIAACGRLERVGVEIWLLNLLFFLGGVLYVKYRVRGLLAHRDFPQLRERLAFAWPVFLYHLLLVIFLATWVWVESRPAVLLIAFTPGVLRACNLLFQLGKRFPIRRLGWTEVVHSLVFAVLLVLAFRMSAL